MCSSAALPIDARISLNKAKARFAVFSLSNLRRIVENTQWNNVGLNNDGPVDNDGKESMDHALRRQKRYSGNCASFPPMHSSRPASLQWRV